MALEGPLSAGAGAAEDEINNISAMLKKGKAEGEKRRRRITYTCYVTGTLGTVVGGAVHRAPFVVVLDERDPSGHPLTFIGLAIAYVSFSKAQA